MAGKHKISGKTRLLRSAAVPLFLLFSQSVPAATAAAEGEGTGAGNFLKIPVGARASSLGSAFSAVGGTPDAVYYNPAGLALLRNAEISLTYDKYIEGVNRQWLALALPAGAGTAGVGLNYLSVSPFASYDANDNRTGSVSASAAALFLSWGATLPVEYGFIRSVSYGASGKYVSETLDTEKGSAMAMDAGLLFNGIKNLRFSLSMSNLVSGKVKFENEASGLPGELKTGVSWSAGSADSFSATLLSAEAGFPEEGERRFSFGLEETLYGVLSLRAGYNSFGDISNGLSFGFGLDMSGAGGRSIRADYSFGATNYFGNIQKLSLSYRFGRPSPAGQDTAKAPESAKKEGPAGAKAPETATLEVSSSFSRNSGFIEKLGESRDWQSVKTLFELLKNNDPRVVSAAAAELNSFDDPQIAVGLLSSENMEARKSALAELELDKNPAALEYISKFLGDKSPEIRQKAAEALGRSGDARAMEPLIQALKNEKFENVKSALIDALNRLSAGGR